MSKFAAIHNLTLVQQAVERLTNRNASLPGLGVLHGPPGYGKSQAMQALANSKRGYYVQVASAWTGKALLEKILFEMGTKGTGTITRMLDQTCAQLASSRRPLLIDEFDHCVAKGSMVELVRDIYEGSQSPIILAGEEYLPQKLERFERFHSRVMTWIPAQPVTVPDAAKLAEIYAADVDVAEDMLERLVDISRGSVRRVCVNLAHIGEEAAMNGWRKVDLHVWGDRKLHKGETPVRRS